MQESRLTAETGSRPDALAGAQRRSGKKNLWRRFSHHKGAVVGFLILATFALLAVFAPLVTWHDPNHTDLALLKHPPTLSHPLGNDKAGRDVLARIIFAGRVSLTVGLVAAVIASFIATSIGLASGFRGGHVDNLLMRFTEVVMTFPAFFIIIIMVSLLGPNLLNIMVIIGLLGWPGTARLVRGQVLSLREREFVIASRAVGGSELRQMFVHILPSVMPYVVVSGMLQVGGAILLEAGLSYLGLGVQIPDPTWGNMMIAANSLDILENVPWIWAPPGFAITSTVMAVNFLGDGLRDALDPHSYST